MGATASHGHNPAIYMRMEPAPEPVLHVSAPVRRGAVADTRLGVMFDLVLIQGFFYGCACGGASGAV